MAYMMTAQVTVQWVPDGAGPLTVPSGPSLQVVCGPNFANVPAVVVPGADAPSTANITAAGATMIAAITTNMNLSIAQIQGWASGGN